MKIELMRKVDYLIGVPLCFILTCIDYILRLFSFKKKEASFKKILFIKLSEMGAIILALPLITKIRNRYPNAEISFLTFKKNSPLFEILNLSSSRNILTIREDSFILFLLDTIRMIKRVRGRKIDAVFDLEFFSRFTTILTYLSGAKKRIGFYRYTFEGLYRGNLLTHNIQYSPFLHISKMYLSLAGVVKLEKKFTPELGEKINDGELILPKVNLPMGIKEKLLERLEKFGINNDKRLFLINPGEEILSLRQWPLKDFIALSKRLLEDNKNYIIIIGNKNGLKRANDLFCAVNSNRCINLVGKTNLVELLSFFEIANVLIINDCGLAHLASLTSVRKVVLFGPESPYLFGPLGENVHIIYLNLPCSPCFSVFNHRRSACKDNRCLKLIKPEEVYNLIKKLGV